MSEHLYSWILLRNVEQLLVDRKREQHRVLSEMRNSKRRISPRVKNRFGKPCDSCGVVDNEGRAAGVFTLGSSLANCSPIEKATHIVTDDPMDEIAIPEPLSQTPLDIGNLG